MISQQWKERFRRRAMVVLILFGIWMALIAGQLVRYMVLERARYLDEFTRRSWRVGTLPALRGRILSREGVPLAWSERHFVLVYTVSADAELVRGDLLTLAGRLEYSEQALRRRIAGRSAGQQATLKTNLSPPELLAMEALAARHPRIAIRNRFTRHQAGLGAALQTRLGQTRVINGVEVGISGFERQFDARLRGQPGRYRVMVDKTGAWIRETWEELTPPTPGFDVYAPVSLE